MPSILQSLKVVAATRPTHISPVLKRRNKLATQIDQQIRAAEAAGRGEQYAIQVIRWQRNKATGEAVRIARSRSVKEAWWISDEGKVLLSLRYGVRTIEFAKGKSAIEVGNLDQLIPTLEVLKAAIQSGEFDEQLSAVAGRLGRQLKSRRTT